MSAVAVDRSTDHQVVLERLREQIRKVEAAPRQYLLTLSTGLPQVDALNLFRLGTVVEVSGEEASGRTSVALKLVAATCRERRLAAWVDGPSELYPPAAVPLGVELPRLLVVRPKAPGHLVWAAVQLLRSGTFTFVVLDLTHTGVRLSLSDTKKLTDAARAGGSLLVVLTGLTAQAQGFVRVELRNAQGDHLRVVDASETLPDLSLEVVKSSRGGLGRPIGVSRAGFSKMGLALRRRATTTSVAGLCVPRPDNTPTYKRPPKRNTMRDGHPGIDGARIGRDTPFRFTRGTA